MADITSPRVIAFCDETMRPVMAQLEAAYWAAKAAVLEASTPEVAGTFSDNADPIRDAANPASGTPNGKKQLTSGLIYKALIDLSSLCADMEQYGGDKLRRCASIANRLAPFDELNQG